MSYLCIKLATYAWAGTVIVTARPSSCSHATDSSQETLQSRYYIVSTIFVFSVFIKTIYKLKYALCKYIYRPWDRSHDWHKTRSKQPELDTPLINQLTSCSMSTRTSRHRHTVHAYNWNVSLGKLTAML